MLAFEQQLQIRLKYTRKWHTFNPPTIQMQHANYIVFYLYEHVEITYYLLHNTELVFR